MQAMDFLDSSRSATIDRVLKGLHLDILTNKRKAGEKLIEADISAQYEVSRGSVRAALNILQGEGLIAMLPNGRKEVVGLTTRQARDLYDLRWLIENRALEIIIQEKKMNLTGMIEALWRIDQAAKNPGSDVDWYELDAEFHRGLVVASENHALLKAWEVNIPVMRVLMQLYRVQDQSGYIAGMYDQHKQIFESAVTGDGRAFTMLRQHIMDACPKIQTAAD